MKKNKTGRRLMTCPFGLFIQIRKNKVMLQREKQKPETVFHMNTKPKYSTTKIGRTHQVH